MMKNMLLTFTIYNSGKKESYECMRIETTTSLVTSTTNTGSTHEFNLFDVCTS